MSLLLALDQGTSSSRSIVFNDAGAIVAMAQREFPQIFPHPGGVEHDPRAIWTTQLATAREALAAAGIVGSASNPPSIAAPSCPDAWAAVQAGVARLDSSIGGLGGCPFAPGASGNIATEDLVYLLRDSGVGVDIDLDAAIEAARVARTAVGHDLPSALLRAGDRIQS